MSIDTAAGDDETVIEALTGATRMLVASRGGTVMIVVRQQTTDGIVSSQSLKLTEREADALRSALTELLR